VSPFRQWWSHIPENIDPYLFEVGSFRVGFYGLMYLAAFLTGYLLAVYRLKHEKFGYTKALIQDYIVWGALGLIIGARLGYVLFYNPGYYAAHPLEIILPFEFDGGFRYTGISGMSYHGGALGVIAASILFLRKNKIGFWEFADFFVPVIPLGYTFGRVGNFINGELYGRATDLPWGMYFPLDPEGLLRHPSQLYEAFFEGIVLFAVLWTVRGKRFFRGTLLGLYLMGYGTVRFFIEFVREPDTHLGAVLGPFTMGQVLCLAMVISGGVLFVLKARAAHADK
jgi:phosphatidylglycerol:prolipoprotein diacylglycerol transferase